MFKNRDEYYDHLQRIRVEGHWEAWVRFFLEGVVTVAGQVTDTIRRIVQMIDRDRRRVQQLGPRAANVLRCYDLAVASVVLTPRSAARRLADAMTEPTVYRAISELEKLDILHEITGRARSRLYTYSEYLSILNEGVEGGGA